MPLIKTLAKIVIIRNNGIYFAYVMLGLTMEGLALAICHDRFSLAEVLSTSWAITERNLCFFGTKDTRILSPTLSIPNSLLVVDSKY